VGAARRQIEGEQAELIRIDGVAKSFGDKLALRNVSFSVPAGQICGLLGPNGAGKTTLFRLLMGILKATAGKLLIDDLDTFVDRVQVMRLIGFLPDEPVFFLFVWPGNPRTERRHAWPECCGDDGSHCANDRHAEVIRGSPQLCRGLLSGDEEKAWAAGGNASRAQIAGLR